MISFKKKTDGESAVNRELIFQDEIFHFQDSSPDAGFWKMQMFAHSATAFRLVAAPSERLDPGSFGCRLDPCSGPLGGPLERV